MKFYKTVFLATLYCLFQAAGLSQKVTNTGTQPVAVIFDTDIGPDYDDVGAITLLHALADSNECRILATMASNSHSRIAAVLSVFNTYFNRPGIPIGVVKGGSVNIGASQQWDSVIVQKYPHHIQSNEDAEDAVLLYRKVLSAQPDQSVTIVTVGFLTNMANLLNSMPDIYSPLDGKTLIKKKVKKLVCMAGRFDAEMKGFKEFNVVKDAASSKIVFDQWNTPIIFTGFEIGVRILTGLPLIGGPISNSPVKEVFEISIPKSPKDKNGRMSWDQTAILIAVRGYEKYFQGVEGRIIGIEDGSHGWDNKGVGHIYVKEKLSVEQITSVINNLMLHQPIKH
ncbi:MAG: nucleoside hydrolase [Chitinophagaceae bacterium]|nr:nucleoside hydrolase [Chitinophagaceae bacterium]